MQKRILTEYKKLPRDIKNALKTEYPTGFDTVLTSVKIGAKGEETSALLYNFNDTLYLIKYRKMKRVDHYLDDDDELENETLEASPQ